MKGYDWSTGEVRATVEDYFAMLRLELLALPYNKAERNRLLRERLEGRSKAAVEMKHQNISSVLFDMGLPFISGYKPMSNKQGILVDCVRTFLEAKPLFYAALAEEAVAAEADRPSPSPGVTRYPFQFAAPPPSWLVHHQGPRLEVGVARVDFAQRDFQNRRLAARGRRYALELETRQLLDGGRRDLAGRVEIVSERRGDGVGFDVLSFDPSTAEERWIAVKTTALGIYTPFCVSAAEVECSEGSPSRYHLYRIYDFYRETRLYRLAGPVSATCHLEPVQWRATVLADQGNPHPRAVLTS